MKTQQLPNNYPNVYFHDNQNHKFGTITFIWFAVTPSGRISKYFKQFRIYKKGKFIDFTQEQLADYAMKNVSLHKLRKGYTWGEMFIQHDFWGLS